MRQLPSLPARPMDDAACEASRRMTGMKTRYGKGIAFPVSTFPHPFGEPLPFRPPTRAALLLVSPACCKADGVPMALTFLASHPPRFRLERRQTTIVPHPRERAGEGRAVLPRLLGRS